MSNVISIDSKMHHVSGDAHCIECGHKWIAVAPIGTTQLECGNCKTMKGIFVNPCCRFDKMHLSCSCGNDYLHVTPEGFHCPRCGCWVKP